MFQTLTIIANHTTIPAYFDSLPQFCLAAAMAGATPLPTWKLYIGGVWTGYSHEDIRRWLYETTSIAPITIKRWQRNAEDTMQSVFVGYASEEQARTVLTILSHRPVMWGARVSVMWSRDNSAAGATAKSAPAPKAGPSSTSRPTSSFVEVGVQTEIVGMVDQEVSSGQDKELGFKEDKAIDARQEEEFPSPSEAPTLPPSTVQLAPTEPANSPTVDDLPSSPATASSEAPTALEDVPGEVPERIKVKRELDEAEQECKKLKVEIKKEKEN